MAAARRLLRCRYGVVWDVDVLRDEVSSRTSRSGQEPRLFRRGEVADAEPALPGWSMPVDDLSGATPGAEARSPGSCRQLTRPDRGLASARRLPKQVARAADGGFS